MFFLNVDFEIVNQTLARMINEYGNLRIPWGMLGNNIYRNLKSLIHYRFSFIIRDKNVVTHALAKNIRKLKQYLG